MTRIDHALLEILRAPVNDERPWMVFGACRGQDPNLFFPDSARTAREAVAICNTCPVVEECLDYSLEARERFGVWGGLTDKQRRSLLRQPA